MAHIHDLIDFTASAFIVHEDKILLVHHKKLNKWLQIGGHIELDENPDQALLREIQEECGLEVEVLAELCPCEKDAQTTPLLRPHFINIHWVSDTHRHCDLGYVCRAITTDPVLEEEGAHAIGWFTEDEIKNLDTVPNLIQLAGQALEIAAKAR
ncbi:DNA mismatch repair protein MutT [Candidatus Uhrbacteria bacterium CG10_big_fil_rev_8_21_14_0_10_50_16]|uniref:DNA mismatch repair protein MutT n=1 Tax=Candidatus Uhrbacteria bacterium CG10_big_fil_rev_8_21_14_0_10_50_16 TaxID=1975039 RepID=A0A2H0RPQ1_9BACT|nr:MAG: DNA mismatch repair protein MutT [Candidatus Uhrbacteria bacterium CG10_big_fil_rev_8_21_14_0_10_50_16]